ncbi:hypothetical protein EDB89DRAFT_876346 [Lactarius sanguifluus]|nr:hypothetical protein EDB89DRAFT_876346 [Lactarius sanguifluus]
MPRAPVGTATFFCSVLCGWPNPTSYRHRYRHLTITGEGSGKRSQRLGQHTDLSPFPVLVTHLLAVAWRSSIGEHLRRCGAAHVTVVPAMMGSLVRKLEVTEMPLDQKLVDTCTYLVYQLAIHDLVRGRLSQLILLTVSITSDGGTNLILGFVFFLHGDRRSRASDNLLPRYHEVLSCWWVRGSRGVT